MKRSKLHLFFCASLLIAGMVIAFLIFQNWMLSKELEEIKVSNAKAMEGPSAPLLEENSEDPFLDIWGHRGLFSLQKRMDDLMNELTTNSPFFNKQGLGFSTASPVIDMKESPDYYKIILEVPEGQEIEVNTELADGRLTISGWVKNTFKDNTQNQLTQSYQESQFSQSVYFSDPVDEGGMRIDHTQNKLTIVVPKR